MDDFIELNRRFAPYNEERSIEYDDLGGFEGNFLVTYSWPDVLQNRGTVVLAEAGTGKSVEFRNQTHQLRKQGKLAFYCPLENLAGLSLQDALQIGTQEELASWIEGDAEAWFFLDAADEAKLRNPRQFERAIVKYAAVVAQCRFRTHTIISTRPNAWNAFSDRETLSRCLGLVLPKGGDDCTEGEEPQRPTPSLDQGSQPSADGLQTPNEPPLPLQEMQLVPLDKDQVRTFAGTLGVSDIDGFMGAIESLNAESFADRPSDLPGLVDLWNRTGRLGSYSEIVLNNIQIKLRESNAIHSDGALLTPEKTLIGAERLAAAATFTRRTSLLISSSSEINDRVRDQAIDPKDVLIDWRPAEMNELLGRALFDESLYGTVRFHHRTTREYLAARWLCRLLRQRKHRRSVYALLFRRPYGTESPVIVPSLKAVAAWIALWDQDIRDQLLRIDSKVLLEFGDSSALAITIRSELLRGYAARYANQNHTPLSLFPSQLRRLAHSDLAGTIHALLHRYATHEDLRHLLLRLVRESRMQGFGKVSLSIATCEAQDKYSRAYAIEIIGVTGSDEEKQSLKRFLLTNPDRHERDLVAYAIRSLFPAVLDIQDVKTLIEATPAPASFGYDSLQVEVDNIRTRLDTPSLRLRFVSMLADLMQRPLHINEYCQVSERFAWLLQPAMTLAEELIEAHPQGPFPEAELDIIAASTNADYLRMYTGDTQKKSLNLLNKNRCLKHCLFWKLVERHRTCNEEPLKDFWQLQSGLRSWLELEDADFFLESVRAKTGLEDKLLSLSMLVNIYRFNTEPADLLDNIRTAVAETPALTAALTEHLRPKELSARHMEAERQHEAMRRESQERERKRQADRTSWIEWLKADPTRVGKLDQAGDGTVLKNTVWLLEDLKKKSGNNTSWTASDWSALVPEFGVEVATAFRDYCIAVWRRYIPKLRSEDSSRENNTPWIVILGLSGLAMEAESNSRWTEELLSEDAILATRYAIWELNGFPTWFESLWRTHPESVETLLLQEISWELFQSQSEGMPGYILSRLRWSTKTLRTEFRTALMALLQAQIQHDLNALSEAMAIILRDGSSVSEEFTAAAIRNVDSAADDETKGFWLAALLCLDAEEAIGRFENWVKESSQPGAAERRVSLVLNHIWGDRFHNFNSEHQSFQCPSVLLRLIKLTHSHVRMEDDIEHDEVYSPGMRDHAQTSRDMLLNVLCKIPGRATHQALIELSRFHTNQFTRDRMLVLAEERAEADCEAEPWEPHNVPEFAADAEREPRSQYDLHLIALHRLDDLKLDLEEGDESEASILRKVGEETELRRIIANRLKQASFGKYTTGSEEELADKKRTDIRLHNPAVEARIPIELKIAERWSAAKLRERMENQLVGQYLREARYGTFLLVRRGNKAKKDKSNWSLRDAKGSRSLNFTRLLAWLEEEAKRLSLENPSVDGLQVVGIDLTARGQKRSQDHTTQSPSIKRQKKRVRRS